MTSPGAPVVQPWGHNAEGWSGAGPWSWVLWVSPLWASTVSAWWQGRSHPLRKGALRLCCGSVCEASVAASARGRNSTAVGQHRRCHGFPIPSWVAAVSFAREDALGLEGGGPVCRSLLLLSMEITMNQGHGFQGQLNREGCSQGYTTLGVDSLSPWLWGAWDTYPLPLSKLLAWEFGTTRRLMPKAQLLCTQVQN